MDLEPFTRINPCGYAGMQMTHMKQLNASVSASAVPPILVREFTQRLGYQHTEQGNWNLKDYE